MPLYKNRIAEELESKKTEFRKGINKDVVDAFQEAVGDLTELSIDEIEEKLSEYELPAAVPTKEFEEKDGLIVGFEQGDDWSSHEAVNNWARDQLEGVLTVSADGSQIDPVKEFEQPVALVQAVWIANNHTTDGEYDEDVETEVLTPEDLLFENPNTGLLQVDDEEVSVKRFEVEMRVLEQQIKKYSDKEETPVVLYDGPLVLSFAQMFSDEVQERYSEALSRLLAASQHHRVPVVGYTAGSKASDIAKMIERLDLVDANRSIRDYQLLDGILESWGDRTIVFNSRRDNSLDWLKTKYHGAEYDFSEDILFTYLKTGSGPQVDRVDFPRWIQQEGLTEYVLSVIRAEAGVGRGYPEILQSVDTDAVISRDDREKFLRMYQDFSDENDIELRWNNKALSKKRRRR
jgi:hypothetical protein